MVFQILVIVSVFMLELVDKLGGKQFWNRPEFLSLPGVLRHFEGDYCLTRGQNHQGGHLGLGSLGCKNHPGESGVFVETLKGFPFVQDSPKPAHFFPLMGQR